MDDYRKELHQALGWMANIRCHCCNPTICRTRHHQEVTKYNKIARRRLKNETKKMLNEVYFKD